MRYMPRGSMRRQRRQRRLGRLEGSVATLAIVALIGFGLIASAPAELYRPAPATHHPTPEGGPTRIEHMQMPPCGPGKDCSELDEGVITPLPHFSPSPTPNDNQVPEPGTLALVGAGIALMMKAKRVTR